MTVKSCLNWRNFNSPGEVNNEPHATIPNDALSIKEILDRYARGLPLGGERVPVYNGEDLIPDFDRMSTIDRMEWLEANALYIQELKESIGQTQTPQTPGSTGGQSNPTNQASAPALSGGAESPGL